MDELTDLVVISLSYLGKWLNAKGERICFIIWCLSLSYWIARNISIGMFFQSGSCFITLCTYIYSFWNWKDKGIGV